MREHKVIVGTEDEGVRLDRWFKRHQNHVPHSLLARLVRAGKITVNGAKADVSTRLGEGDVLLYPPIEAAEAKEARASARPVVDLSAEDLAFVQSLVIHRDPDTLVINKPPGLATQGGTKTHKHLDGLLDGLMFERSARPKLVHRLDKDTSGVLLLARHANAAGFFSKAFAGRTVQKTYWALVVGSPKGDEGVINAAIEKQPGSGGEKMMVDPKGQFARTAWRVVERTSDRCTWLELRPLTGRTHQLRVHCAEVLGCPIVGDAKYGGPAAFLTGGISRKLHLHARRLVIDHPSQEGARFGISADLPSHILESFAMLGLNVADAPDDGWMPKALEEKTKRAPRPEDWRKRTESASRNTRRGARRAVGGKPKRTPRG